MCRLFAVRAERPVRVHRAFKALRRQALEHKDGWGIARFDGQTPHLEVNITSASQCSRFEQLGEELATRSLITHIRLASVGSVTQQNAHPFFARGWAFMHNGTVLDYAKHSDAIRAHVAPNWLAGIKGETDSETCFAMFQTFLDKVAEPKLEDVQRALAKVMTTVAAITDHSNSGKRSAMNFIVTDGERLIATRRGRTLFFASEPGARFIASEALWDDGEWNEVSEEGMVTVDEHLGVRTSRVSDWA